MLHYDTGRAFSLRWFYLGSLSIVLMACISRLDTIRAVWESGELLEYGWTLNFVNETLCQEGILFVLPILSTLPFASSFIDEWKAGMVRLAVTRIEKRTYLCSKAFVTALSGGCILAAGALLLLIVSMMIFSPIEQPMTGSVADNTDLQLYIGLLIRYFTCGMLWAEIGLFFSTLLNHRYMAWLSPFMVYYLLIIFHERYFEWCFILYPKEWVIPERQWPFDNWGICLWLAALTVLTGWGFYKSGERRLHSV